MNLHKDRETFSDILNLIADQTGIRADILEKDYYVCLLLEELSGKQNELPAFFKGGTALYKALGTIQRFSEDIDLTVRITDCSKSQAKRRLERSAQDYKTLDRTKNTKLEHNRKGSISCAFDYSPINISPTVDSLQRFGHVRVEATSFTVSEPTIKSRIAPVIFEMASLDQRETLSANYAVSPFMIETIRIERIFADKIFAAEFYYSGERRLFFDVAKHMYDIAVMSNLDIIKKMLGNPIVIDEMVGYKRKEEALRFGSDLSDKPFNAFALPEKMKTDKELEVVFSRMQEVYIFNDLYKITYEDVCDSLLGVFTVLS